MKEKPPASTLFWRLRLFLLILLGGFFLVFGFQLLMAAYRLQEPYSFILTFFASNLIILISLALLIGFIYRLIRGPGQKISGGED